jgi:signal peptidase I
MQPEPQKTANATPPASAPPPPKGLAGIMARVRATLKPLVPKPIADFWARDDVKAVWDWVKEPLYAVLLMFGFTSIVVQPFYVPSGSMEPTLAIGDAVLAAKFPYGYTRYSLPFDYIFLGQSTKTPTPVWQRLPKVGDVIVFRLTSNPKITFVKRVVGLPGDRIQMKEGYLWINGNKLPLNYVGMGDDEDSDGSFVPTAVYDEILPNGRTHHVFKKLMEGPANNTEEYLVPQDHVFMMGDNRDDSCDSRFPLEQCGVGFVPTGNLVGRAFIVIGSVDFKNAAGFWEWPLYFRGSRLFNLVR